MDFALNNCWIHVQYGKGVQWNSFSSPSPWSHVAPLWQGANICPMTAKCFDSFLISFTLQHLRVGLKNEKRYQEMGLFPEGWGIVADVCQARSATTDQVSFSHLFLSILSSLNPPPSWGQAWPWDRALWGCPNHGIRTRVWVQNLLDGEKTSEMFHKIMQSGNNLKWWGWDRSSREGTGKRNIRETNGENGHALLHLSNAADCGRWWSQRRPRQNFWGNGKTRFDGSKEQIGNSVLIPGRF